jgi:uncharacterized protein DUF4129
VTLLELQALQGVPPDSLRALLRHVFAAREYQWRAPTALSLTWLTAWFERILAWLSALHETHPWRFYVVLGALTLVLIAIVAHLSYVVWRALRPSAPAARTVGGAPPPALDAAWHLAEARRLSAASRYVEALGHRFVALVLELDRRRALSFHPSKTPAEYVVEARLTEPGREELAALVASLYRHVFGGDPCGQEEWRLFDGRAGALAGLSVAAR